MPRFIVVIGALICFVAFVRWLSKSSETCENPPRVKDRQRWETPSTATHSSFNPPRPYRSSPGRRSSSVRKYRAIRGVDAPSEKDMRLRTFQVVNPEGEVYSIDTADKESLFYGPTWARILDAQENGEFIRGRVDMRRISSLEDRFSGYTVNIDGVEAFLPASKAAYFYHPEHDATGKCIALKVCTVYPNGPRQGNVIVDAYAPLKYVMFGQKKSAYTKGGAFYALAMDYNEDDLLFPWAGNSVLRVRLREAMETAEGKGADSSPDMLTGCYWRLMMKESAPLERRAAALDVLV